MALFSKLSGVPFEKTKFAMASTPALKFLRLFPIALLPNYKLNSFFADFLPSPSRGSRCGRGNFPAVSKRAPQPDLGSLGQLWAREIATQLVIKLNRRDSDKNVFGSVSHSVFPVLGLS